ncbi:MAG: carboxypeptidase regulatory-like domain-containing protein [Chloroflexi bacterium]|nr:carboxypeptidase regulatory-like domain-containing protein [Chloroflexota bacterium]
MLLAAIVTPSALGATSSSCQFILGFKTLHDLIPSTVGDCLDNQAFAADGDAQQHTTNGLLVWRKSDNYTAFTDGYHTWVNGPNGVESRLNTQVFPWETPAASPNSLSSSALAAAVVSGRLIPPLLPTATAGPAITATATVTPTPAPTQVPSGSVGGTIRTPTYAGVSGINVQLLDYSTGCAATQTQTTDQNGNFAFTGIPIWNGTSITDSWVIRVYSGTTEHPYVSSTFGPPSQACGPPAGAFDFSIGTMSSSSGGAGAVVVQH